MRKHLYNPVIIAGPAGGGDTAWPVCAAIFRCRKSICCSVIFRAVILLFMALAGNLLLTRPASADQCRFTSVPSVMSFGSIYSGNQGTFSQPLQWQCTSGLINLQAQTAACYTVEPAVADLSGTTRVMRGTSGLAASYRLLFNLVDSGQNVLVGARVTAQFGQAPQMVMVTGILGLVPIWATYNQTIIGNIPANQVVPAGVYQTTSTLYVFYRSALLGIALDCWNGQTITNTVTITATVQPQCNVSASNIDFGSNNTLSQPLYAQGTISVNCTLAQPYQISLSTNGYPANQRRMINGTRFIQYGLFSDSAYTNPWGTTVPITGVGTGLNQTIPVYALVPAQATPGTGVFTDTVAISVNY